ncbi:hypothetical protein N9H39_12105, partial [Gammaproteobacteria bacterium]|nr:hypothetical protein [Gammaproteobacteria bacterium]
MKGLGPESGFRLYWSLGTLSERICTVGHSRTGRTAILLGIMVLGVLVRLDALYDYLAEPEKFFYLGEPLERSVDGYRTLTHARDLLAGNYEGLDVRRRVPEYSERPWPPMLMALLAAGLNQLTGISLNWIAGFLPVLLGPLIALPLYGLGRYYGGVAMGMSSALLGTLAMASVSRSSFGWFDTDCLNVTFLLATAYFALRFGTLERSRRYLYLGAYALVTL